jgi:hypothetical protein
MINIFFTRRYVWLPKWWFLIILLLLGSFLLLLGVKNIANFLAITSLTKSEFLIVEGWQDNFSLKQALDLFNSNSYQVLITTGGPIKRQLNTVTKDNNYADYAASYFLSNGVKKSSIVSLPTPDSAQNRTFLSAVVVRKWFEKNDYFEPVITVATQGVHARRTRLLYERAFHGKAEVGIYSSKPLYYALDRWWETSIGSKAVITETIGVLWVVCCFANKDFNSHQEMWGE